MNRFAALLIAVLVLPSPALAEQKRPLVLIDDDVAPLPSTDTIGTRPNSPIDVADYMTAEQVADVIAGTKTLDVTQAVQNWIAACVAQHRACSAMPGIYRLSGPIVFEQAARKRVVEGKSVSVRVDLGGRRIIKNKKKNR